MKKIILINPFGIGDVLFTTPLIKALKDSFPDSHIAYWCNERVAPLFRNAPNINKLFTLSRGDLKKIYNHSWVEGSKRLFSLFSEIKKGKFDLAIDFSLDHRYGLFCKLAGIKKRIGFNYKKRGRFLSDKISISGYQDKHIAEYYLSLLYFIGIAPTGKELFLSLPQENRIKADIKIKRWGIKDGDLLVGIVPGAGASWGKDAHLKHWPPLKYAQLADRIIAELKAKVLILADGSEKYISDIIISAMKNKALDLTGKTSLEELIAIIGRIGLLITNDGGPLHIAVALGKKTVSLFGPVDENVYGPYPLTDNHRVIKKDLPCRPCYKNFRFPGCPYNRKCIQDISVDEVYSAAKSLL